MHVRFCISLQWKDRDWGNVFKMIKGQLYNVVVALEIKIRIKDNSQTSDLCDIFKEDKLNELLH